MQVTTSYHRRFSRLPGAQSAPTRPVVGVLGKHRSQPVAICVSPAFTPLFGIIPCTTLFVPFLSENIGLEAPELRSLRPRVGGPELQESRRPRAPPRHQETTKRMPGEHQTDYEKTTRRPPITDDTRRTPGDQQETAKTPPEVFWFSGCLWSPGGLLPVSWWSLVISW